MIESVRGIAIVQFYNDRVSQIFISIRDLQLYISLSGVPTCPFCNRLLTEVLIRVRSSKLDKTMSMIFFKNYAAVAPEIESQK